MFKMWIHWSFPRTLQDSTEKTIFQQQARQQDCKKKKKKPRKEIKNDANKSVIDYIFHLDDGETMKCNIKGVTVDMLIDSRSRCNIITDRI